MKNMIRIAAAIGFVLVMVPWSAGGQALADQPAKSFTATPMTPMQASTAVPVDQQPTKEQLVKLFDLIRTREQMESITKIFPEIMQQQMAAQMRRMQQEHPEIAPMTEMQQQVVKKVMNKFMGRLLDLYRFDEMIEDMAGLYRKHMTSSDVEGIINFYSSPAGQHWLDVQPAMLREYLPLALERMQDRVRPLMDEILKEMRAEMAKSGAGFENAGSQILPPSTSSGNSAAAQPKSPGQVYEWAAGETRVDAQGNRVTNPKAIVMPLPPYTEEARKAGIEGMVVLQGIVRKDGTIDSCRVMKGLGYGLDESAINTITNNWRFDPGTLYGKPVDVLATLEVHFRLYSKPPAIN